MNPMDIPEITLSGSPFEKGYAHGSLCRDRVMRSLETYRRKFAGKGPAPDTPPERLGEAGATNYAFVADLTARRFRFVMGNPCEGAFRDVAFP